MVKDYYMDFHQNKLTRPTLQRYKLGICVEFPIELLEFIAEQRRETKCAKITLTPHNIMS
jgi:hypothetical protein